MARIYAQNFNSIDDWKKASTESYESIYGIGLKTAESTSKWMLQENNIQELALLQNKLTIEYPKASSVKQVFEGMTFVITGSFDLYSRDDIKTLILNHGGKVSSTVSSVTRYVVAGEKVGSKKAKAEALAKRMNSLFPKTEFIIAEKKQNKFYMVIHTTPLGLRTHSYKKMLTSYQAEVAFDLLYHAKLTPFLKEAKHKKMKTISGQDMFIAQALASFEIWQKKFPPGKREEYHLKIKKYLKRT